MKTKSVVTAARNAEKSRISVMRSVSPLHGEAW
jgi:hypothetical protein